MTTTRRGLEGSRAWTSKLDDACGTGPDWNSSVTPFDLRLADRRAVGPDHLDRHRLAGVGLEVERHRLGLGVDDHLGDDGVAARDAPYGAAC